MGDDEWRGKSGDDSGDIGAASGQIGECRNLREGGSKGHRKGMDGSQAPVT